MGVPPRPWTQLMSAPDIFQHIKICNGNTRFYLMTLLLTQAIYWPGPGFTYIVVLTLAYNARYPNNEQGKSFFGSRSNRRYAMQFIRKDERKRNKDIQIYSGKADWGRASYRKRKSNISEIYKREMTGLQNSLTGNLMLTMINVSALFHTVCPRRLGPFNIETYYIYWVKTSRITSTSNN